MFKWLRRVFDRGRWDIDELCRRLDMPQQELERIEIAYHRFTIPKRRGGVRTILAPAAPLKRLQRRIARRLLAHLAAHPACHGFERGRSIVTNALPHAGRRTVIRMDVRDFFASTTADRVQKYFRAIGWKIDAADLLTRLCTCEGALPPGAPTSPRLANLVNYRLDARLHAIALRSNAAYTRYADDLTFSADDPAPAPAVNPKTMDPVRGKLIRLNAVIPLVKAVLTDYGYRLHQGPKLRIMRRSQRQLVTGLVVNERVRLPRSTRRRLRAIEHQAALGKPVTLTPQQLQGWRALAAMVDREPGATPDTVADPD